ncbi:hypothetical protein PMAYCL1PPCAC_30663, partial [Pristionchus mayeri]
RNEQLWGTRMIRHLVTYAPERSFKCKNRITSYLLGSITGPYSTVRKAAGRGFRDMASHPKWAPAIVRAKHELTSALEDSSGDKATVEWALTLIRNICCTFNVDNTIASSSAIREAAVNKLELNLDNQVEMKIDESGSRENGTSSGMATMRRDDAPDMVKMHESPSGLITSKRAEPLKQQYFETIPLGAASSSSNQVVAADATGCRFASSDNMDIGDECTRTASPIPTDPE